RFIFYRSLDYPHLHSFPTRRSSDLDVRQDAFEALYEVYGGLKNTFASTFQTNVKKNNYLASTKKIQISQTSCPFKQPHPRRSARSEEHTSELQSRFDLVCRLLLEKK